MWRARSRRSRDRQATGPDAEPLERDWPNAAKVRKLIAKAVHSTLRAASNASSLNSSVELLATPQMAGSLPATMDWNAVFAYPLALDGRVGPQPTIVD